MQTSRWNRWKKAEREDKKRLTPTGRLVKDLPEWQISALKAGAKKTEIKGEQKST